MMIKLQLQEGTKGSRQLLQTLNEEGAQNDDIFMYTSVQKLLDYKQKILAKVTKGYFLQYGLYLGCLLLTPLLWPDDFVVIMLWMFAQIWLEYIQSTSKD
jgi:hypothetical protein